MICEKCGQWIEDGSKACGSCGTPVNVQGVQNAQGTDAAAQGAANGVPAAVQPGMAAGVDAGGMGAGGYAVNPGQGGQPPLTKDQFTSIPMLPMRGPRFAPPQSFPMLWQESAWYLAVWA